MDLGYFIYREDRGWGFSQLTESAAQNDLEKTIHNLESRLSLLEDQLKPQQNTSGE